MFTFASLVNFADWWGRHSIPIIVTSLFGLAIAERFLAGHRARVAADPVNGDYVEPRNDLDK
jgi:hypothetical protein